MQHTYPTTLRYLADNVRRQRKSLCLSQEELALRAAVDRTYVSQIERAVGNPSLLILCKLAEVLDADVANLLSRASDNTGSTNS